MIRFSMTAEPSMFMNAISMRYDLRNAGGICHHVTKYIRMEDLFAGDLLDIVLDEMKTELRKQIQEHQRDRASVEPMR